MRKSWVLAVLFCNFSDAGYLFCDFSSRWTSSTVLAGSKKPFYHKSRHVLIERITRGTYKLGAIEWDSAKEFVKNLLVIDPEERMDAATALKHHWIVNVENAPKDLPSADLVTKIEDSLSNYCHVPELNKLALRIIAHRSTQSEIGDLCKIFEEFDTEPDVSSDQEFQRQTSLAYLTFFSQGMLSMQEFQAALRNLNCSKEALEGIFQSLDLNQNGHVNWTEFLAGTIESRGEIEDDRLAEAFDRLDEDQSGFITREDLIKCLGEDYKTDADAIIKSADKNNDRKISFVSSQRSSV
jgi:calcium-dependent protein kinase